MLQVFSDSASGAGVSTAEHRQPLVAALPAVAVRAMEDRASVALGDTWNLRELVVDAGGEQEKSRPFPRGRPRGGR